MAAETFTQLLHSPPPQEVREPRALLTTISRRIVYELWRRRDLEEACLQALAHVSGDVQAISPEDQLQLLQALRAMDQALAGLSAKECAAFLLYKLDGLTYQPSARNCASRPAWRGAMWPRACCNATRPPASRRWNRPRHGQG